MTHATREPLAVPGTALTVGAHPDDAEFGAGATLARWADAGCRITMCVVTDGSKGSWDPDLDTETLVATRIAEQQAAMEVIGARDVAHLGEVDGEVVDGANLRQRIATLIREVQPDVVLTHDPWRRYELHPDHRATGMATIDAVVAAREPRAMRESGLASHRPAALLLWSADESDHAEPVEDAGFERKVHMLLCHRSQIVTTMGSADSGDDEMRRFRDHLWTKLTSDGRQLGVGPSETFKRLTP